MDDYAKARYKSNGRLTVMKLTSPDGGMNPDMSSVDFIQDGDLNKSLKHYVSIRLVDPIIVLFLLIVFFGCIAYLRIVYIIMYN